MKECLQNLFLEGDLELFADSSLLELKLFCEKLYLAFGNGREFIL